ncbi:hypothetical protein Pfo_017375 [Paulownia fortunei]|nr:hypothetical protein Pfo_017375 [Paulownia fortunei]
MVYIVFKPCKWKFEGLISDISVDDYITATAAKHPIYMPLTAGRYQVKRFTKAQGLIVKMVDQLTHDGCQETGKKLMAVGIVKHAMEIIDLLTDQSPIIVDAVINIGPREDATRIGSADISPVCRVNQALYLLTSSGGRQRAFRNIRTIAECLADELINATRKGHLTVILSHLLHVPCSCAIKKKEEIERMAKANP